jgi:hypothetical protein
VQLNETSKDSSRTDTIKDWYQRADLYRVANST